MELSKNLEQHIAVFGGSGSGKTVLVSSFYGAAQEPQYLQDSPFRVVAEDIGLGSRLHKNYLGMKKSAEVPSLNKFGSTEYSFVVKLKNEPAGKAAKNQPFNALRLVWHDYPGEWFEQSLSGPTEDQRRVDTFRSLLRSDAALLLVDGQQLLDHAGEEERYLKSLFGNLCNGLLSLKDDLLDQGKPLVQFPRIWIMALSKSDLLPETDVFEFRDLLVEKACDEIDELRKVLAGFLEGSGALSVGEDFMLLSSAKFEPGKIEVAERVGLDLVLPLAAVLPFERHVRWSTAKDLPAKVAEDLLEDAVPLAATLLGRKTNATGPLGVLMNFLGSNAINEAANLMGDKLREVNAEARSKHDNLRAILAGFKLDLNRGEQEKVLLRSVG